MEHEISQRSTGFHSFMKETARQESSTAKIPKKSLANCRAIQAHNGGIPTDPELMEFIRILFKWKEFIFHRCCSFSIQSILENGLIPGGKEKQIIFHTTLSFGGGSDEKEFSDDHATPQKVHYHSHWKRNQDAVYWVKLAQAQGQGLQFLANNVTCDHRYTILCQQSASTK